MFDSRRLQLKKCCNITCCCLEKGSISPCHQLFVANLQIRKMLPLSGLRSVCWERTVTIRGTCGLAKGAAVFPVSHVGRWVKTCESIYRYIYLFIC